MSASVIVIGGGPTGLSATYHLGQDAILLEQNDTIGGWYRSIEDGGFTFDYAGHIMFSKDEYVHAMYRTLLGDNVHWQDREAWVYSKNVYTRYPFQGALYGLPADVIKECTVGAVEARYGKTEERSGAMIAPAKPASAGGKIAANGNGNGNGHAVSANGNGKANGMYSAAAVIGKSNRNGHAASANGNGAASSGIHGADDKEVVDCCTDGTTEIASGATVTASEMPDIKAGEPRNFEEFIYKVWGAGIAKHFAIPYNRKLWAVPLAEMETSWLGGRVPLPNLEEMIESALSPVAKPMGPNARFGYPLRDGLRWHLIEQKPGRYDWSSCLPQLRAAQATGTQVIWDLCHYGWPDDLDLWSPAFVERFARFARAAAQIVRDETDSVPLYVPINEMSFWSWGGGEVAYLNPFERGRGFELKVQLARASIAAIEEIWQVDARARIIHADPLINIASDPTRPDTARSAEGNHQAQYQGWDLLSGRLWPQIGGDPRYLDIIGVNYYHTNQWIHDGPTIDVEHPLYRPFRTLVQDVYRRYERPIVVAETGIEAERRPAWLRAISQEVRGAMAAGVPVAGLCWYPILGHVGWDNERYCPNGLLELNSASGERSVYAPLAAELRTQQAQCAAIEEEELLELHVG